jgi:hypothetical protein
MRHSVITPTIWLDKPADVADSELDIADEFVRERMATRYDNRYSPIIDAWISVLVGGKDDREMTSFGIQDGIDAAFVLSRGTAYSMKAK